VPELPEVETLRRALSATVVGRRITAIESQLPKLFVGPEEPEALVGGTVICLRRRAKFMIWDFSSRRALVMHLKLSGQLVHRDDEGRNLAAGGHPVPAFDTPLPHKATHAIMTFDDGSRLFVTDIRQFARLRVMPADEVPTFLEPFRFGPEPLSDEFGVDSLARGLQRHRRLALKPALLEQRTVAGLGNIYVDESLWRAGLHPLRPAGGVTEEELERLHTAIRSVIDRAVTHGVAEILNGRASPNHDFPAVHGREGAACPRCGTTLEKLKVAQRGTYVCGTCQVS